MDQMGLYLPFEPAQEIFGHKLYKSQQGYLLEKFSFTWANMTSVAQW